jgi:uncharacterized protein YdeI (YjbR/CyaY-like superfamily)
MMRSATVQPHFFATPEDFRAWLEAHHADTPELLVGFHKKGSGMPSITWSEAVDEALCFGWIDGIRRSLDPDSYSIRFTPRRPRSTWSAVNIGRARELARLGRMRPAGLDAFEARADDRSAIYSYEQRHAATLEPEHEQQFRANEKAWEFFQAQPPSYRKAAVWWVVSAKKDETRRKRLATLIDDSAHGRRIHQLSRPAKPV